MALAILPVLPHVLHRMSKAADARSFKPLHTLPQSLQSLPQNKNQHNKNRQTQTRTKRQQDEGRFLYCCSSLYPDAPRSAAPLLVVVVISTMLAHDVQIVLLQEAQVLPRLSKLALLHALIDVVVDVRPLGIHHVVPAAVSLKDPADGDIVA